MTQDPHNSIPPVSDAAEKGNEGQEREELTPGQKELVQRVLIKSKELQGLLNESKMEEARISCAELNGMLQERETAPLPSSQKPGDGLEIALALPGRAETRTQKGTLLIIDDSQPNREILQATLEAQGFVVSTAETGEEGLWMMQSQAFDLLLLDLTLPGMSGYEVLKLLKSDIELRHIPIIVISGTDITERIVECIEGGAEDFLTKPFNPVLLRARIDACLEKKRLRDHEQKYFLDLNAEKEKSESLLLNVLPRAIAERLKAGEKTIVDLFPEATVAFADLAGFTAMATHMSPSEVVHYLNDIFSQFDELAEKKGLEKIKTIGDAYMVVGGLPLPRPDHAEAVADMALEMQRIIASINAINKTSLKIRVGINTGPVVAGIIGRKKFIYDLWGDTVNTASRMESHGHPGHIQVTETTYELIKDKFIFAKRGSVAIKGKGEMVTYLIMDRRKTRQF